MLLRNIPCLSHAIRLDPQLQFMVKFGKLKLRKWPGERKFLSTKKKKKQKRKFAQCCTTQYTAEHMVCIWNGQNGK